MINNTSNIVWLVYLSGFGGDQLYYLLNQTRQFAFYNSTWSRVTDQGKRLVEDLFGYSFQTNNLKGRTILSLKTSDELLHVVNQCIVEPDRVINWNLPVIIKTHLFCSQAHLERISPGSKVIFMNSNSKNYQRYHDMAFQKNQEFDWFTKQDEGNYLRRCQWMHNDYPTAYDVDADAFFSNQQYFWNNLKSFLNVEFDVNAVMNDHAVYLAKQS